MRLTAWFHIWGDGAWREPLADFRAALERSEFGGDVHYVLVGRPDWNEWHEHGVVVSQWHRSGNEHLTINAIRRYAQARTDRAVLYAHTKGAHDTTEFRTRWRRSMTTHVVENWQANLSLLVSRADAVGCHWLTEEQYPGMFGPMTVPAEGSGFFGGNFWMARCDYLATLPECPADPRWEAETWIGINKPRVVDLLPGWPHDNRWPELL